MAVILVEDETLICDMLQEDMELAGLPVISVANAEAGLNLIERQDSPPCAVVTDINLGPGMNGAELADTIRRRWPTIPVVVMTGDDRNLQRLPLDLREGCFLKPFSPQRLASRVADLVEVAGR
jgi:DNA-binding NtrC family response regulator